MREWLVIATAQAIVVIDWMALVVVVAGSLEAFARVVALLLSGSDPLHRREVWLRWARWLVAGLTFQLAADIIETSVTEDWTSVGRIAAIAVVRTFLNFFLERDLAEVREQRGEASARAER